MRFMTTFALCLALLLAPTAATTVLAADAATPAEIAAQTRASWAKSRDAYLALVKPYQGTPADAALVTQYTAALDKTGSTLEQYLALKLASPATPADKLTPVVDQLYKDLLVLRAIRSKATGGLATALGTALTQHNLVTQTALANMR